VAQDYKRFKHPWEAVFNAESKALILGSFPSPASREFGFYYGHPRNAFWRVLAEVLGVEEPADTIAARREFVLLHKIALWDTIESCEIKGASDSAIRNAAPHKFKPLLAATKIRHIFTNGKKSAEIFNSLAAAEAKMSAIYLPSTSPANVKMFGDPAFRAAWNQVAEAVK
jgi:hypoxanthine-DNA glycosylase